ncbi:MAG: phosphatase PAP2 family protein [bacterium]|nr:phosphatase PAP2 family protein [bacterium]
MKKIDKKPLIITICLIVFQTICYKASVLISGQPTLIGGYIDERIPFNVYFIIPYVIWYLMLVLVPYYIYIHDKDNFIRYQTSFVLSIIISNIIYIIFPSTIVRAEITTTGILETITKIIYAIDTPVRNCCPSIHCAFSLSYILYSYTTKKSNKFINIIITILSLLIMASTMLIKQHVFIDFISGCILSLIVFLIVLENDYLFNKFKKLFKM